MPLKKLSGVAIFAPIRNVRKVDFPAYNLTQGNQLSIVTQGGRSFAVTTCQLWNSLTLELRNFRKFKVALNPNYRLFLTLPKVASYPAYQKSIKRRNLTVPFLKFKRLRLKLRVFLAGQSVAMVTYCVTKIIPSCSPMIRQFFDTMIVASIVILPPPGASEERPWLGVVTCIPESGRLKLNCWRGALVGILSILSLREGGICCRRNKPGIGTAVTFC